jgi:hypothetical protein
MAGGSALASKMTAFSHVVGSIERKERDGMLALQFTKNAIAANFSTGIGRNQSTGFYPEYFHQECLVGKARIYSAPAVAERILSTSAPRSLPSVPLPL